MEVSEGHWNSNVGCQRTRPIRVVHMGSGHTGIEGLKGILADPALELVGWYVSSPEKEGLDAGEFCSLPGVGIKATRSIDALLKLKPDCAYYGSSIIGREKEATAEVVCFLERGINVATFALLQMVYASAAPEEMRQAIEQACEKGDATFFASGSEPGVFTTTLPATLLSAAGRITRYREQQFIPDIIAAYPVVDVIRDSMGFGQPMATTPRRFADGTALEWWKPNLCMIADKLGVEIEDVTFTLKKHALDRDIDTELGLFKAGTMGAYWWELAAIINGKPALSIEYICQLTRECTVPVDWPQAAPDTRECAVVYRVEGVPELKMQVYMSNTPGEKNPSVRVTALHVVNAIPCVVAADKGIHNALELPYYTTRNIDF